MNNYFKLFCHRISKDFKQKQLLPLKLLFFMHSSTILILYPYLTIHMRELGINVEETAIMAAVSPAVAILMPPLAGMIADKIGNFRVMLAFFSGVGGLAALLLLLVPVGRITITYPSEVIFEMSCATGSPLSLSLYQNHPCSMRTDKDRLNATKLELQSCGFACQAILDENRTNNILSAKSYGLQIHDIEKNLTNTYTYTLTDKDIFVPTLISQALNHKTLKNNERYRTSIRKLSKNTYYFPTNALFNFSCDISNDANETDCIFGTKDQIGLFEDKLDRQFYIGLNALNLSHDDILEERQLYKIDYIDTKMKHHTNTICSEGIMRNGKHISVNIPIYHQFDNTSLDDDTTYKSLDLGSCAPRCLASTPRDNICSNSNHVIELDMRATFWSYLVVRVFIGIVSGTSFAMFEGAVIAILREHKADYGLQRIYATIGGMISSPISGVLIDFASRGKGYTDYTPIFILYAALKLISGILMLFINLEFKQGATSVVADVIAVLKKVELIALFISSLILGSAWGFIESFLFWLLQDLGASKSLMGLTITVGGFVGIPLLVLSGPIIKRIGHANVIFIGFVFFVIRLIGYSLIYNPWLCLIFEAMESVTMGLCFTASVTYAAKLSSITTDSTIQGMLGGLYFGVGKGVGSLVGGYLIKANGIRSTFQIFSIYVAITGLIYVAFYHFYMKKRPSQGTDITKKDVDTKLPQAGFVDIDLNAKVNGHPDVPAVYEDALANPAYEETEFDDDDDDNSNEKAIHNENGKTIEEQRNISIDKLNDTNNDTTK